MEYRSSSQQTNKQETSKQKTVEILTIHTKDSGTSAHNETGNQKTQETPTSQTSEEQLTYTVDSETHKKISFISMTNTTLDPELISVCGCLLSGDSDSFEETPSLRKRRILSSVQTVDTYLRERRIPELIRFILAKMMCNKPRHVETYLAELLDKCMCFRAGYGQAPVLFEERHLEAVIKSFDPGDRGWLSAGQVRRAFTTLGLSPKSDLKDRISTSEALNLLRETQERELFSLLTSGCDEDYIL